MTDRVTLEKKGPVGLVTLNSPDTSNAMDPEIGRALVSVLEELSREKALRAAVLTGRGRSFSAGANIKAIIAEMETKARPPAEILESYVDIFNRAGSMMSELDIPVVGAINGAASGGGLALAMACDLVLASSEAVFDPAYVRLGLVPVGGLSMLLPRWLGMKRAAEFLYLARPISAVEARDLGLVNRVLPLDQVLPEALSLAEELSGRPGLGLARTKRLLNRAGTENLAGQIAKEKEYLHECADTPEHRALMKALAEKLK